MKKPKMVKKGKSERLSYGGKTSVTGEVSYDRLMGWYKNTPRPESALGGFAEGVRSISMGLRAWMK